MTKLNQAPKYFPNPGKRDMKSAPPKRSSSEWAARYHDLLEIARLVSWCTNYEHMIGACLDHLSQRLGARARCALVEGDELRLRCWVGKYECSMEQLPICRESIVWDVFRKNEARNVTDPISSAGYGHTLKEQVAMKAIVPLIYVDPLSQVEKKVGILIVDPGEKGVTVSDTDFEYLKVVGELIGAAVGKARLVSELIESYKQREEIVRKTAHNFRNRIAAIGGFSGRIARETKDDELAKDCAILCEEAISLEENLKEFEKYMDTGLSGMTNGKTTG